MNNSLPPDSDGSPEIPPIGRDSPELNPDLPEFLSQTFRQRATENTLDTDTTDQGVDRLKKLVFPELAEYIYSCLCGRPNLFSSICDYAQSLKEEDSLRSTDVEAFVEMHKDRNEYSRLIQDIDKEYAATMMLFRAYLDGSYQPNPDERNKLTHHVDWDHPEAKQKAVELLKRCCYGRAFNTELPADCNEYIEQGFDSDFEEQLYYIKESKPE